MIQHNREYFVLIGCFESWTKVYQKVKMYMFAVCLRLLFKMLISIYVFSLVQ